MISKVKCYFYQCKIILSTEKKTRNKITWYIMDNYMYNIEKLMFMDTNVKLLNILVYLVFENCLKQIFKFVKGISFWQLVLHCL